MHVAHGQPSGFEEEPDHHAHPHGVRNALNPLTQRRVVLLAVWTSRRRRREIKNRAAQVQGRLAGGDRKGRRVNINFNLRHMDVRRRRG